ncbi:MAG: peptidylprolyl isomerase [Anaerolineae bacterium]|nr:peptidylprolyl isomerase [Anaerolineae bacterium]NUQ03012.1 peptidylprolyl isomerase [Anaerolineae bacterium]
MTRKSFILLLAPAIFAMTACGGSPQDSSLAATASAVPTAAATVPTAVPLPTDESGEPLVARVNGEPITLEAFRRMVARFQAEPSLRNDPEGLREVVMRTLVEQVLIEQEAARLQIAVSDAEVDGEVARMVDSAGGEGNWSNWLAQNMYTAEEFRALLYATLLTNRVRDQVTGALDQPVAQVHARHILVTTRDEATALLVRLRNREDFTALAAAFSLDTTTNLLGGDLGWFTQDELLEPELARIAFELEANQIAGPVETGLGYHIIQTLEKDVRPVSDEKRAVLAQVRFEQWLASLAESATIEQYL